MSETPLGRTLPLIVEEETGEAAAGEFPAVRTAVTGSRLPWRTRRELRAGGVELTLEITDPFD